MIVIVITPRNSPRLYIRDAWEHYNLNKNVGEMVDEWKKCYIFKPDNRFHYA